MNFDVRKLKEIARQMTDEERAELEYRDKNRDWLEMSEKVALKIRYTLRMLGLTQKELAKRMHVSQAQVAKILSGKENLGLKTFAKLEKALGINLLALDTDASYFGESDTVSAGVSPSNYSIHGYEIVTTVCTSCANEP